MTTEKYFNDFSEEWQKIKKHCLRFSFFMQPEPDLEFPVETTMFSVQHPYVQKNIRRLENKIFSAQQAGYVHSSKTTTVEEEIKSTLETLYKWVPLSVISRCAAELSAARELKKECINQYPNPNNETFDPSPDAPTIQEQARYMGLTMYLPNTKRGLYIGPVVGQDYQGCLIKWAREKGIELPFVVLAEGQPRPKIGQIVEIQFKKGELTVSYGK